MSNRYKHRRTGAGKPGPTVVEPRWQPLGLATPIAKTPEQIEALVASSMRAVPGTTRESVLATLEAVVGQEFWMNDQYVVSRRRFESDGGAPALVHLSIRRADRAPVRDWRDMQRIKNQLVGPECEGVELYPAESDVVDLANQFHLWVIDDPNFRYPFGFRQGRHVSSEGAVGAKQRPLEDEDAG